ncbi:nuclear transport factor 2 family protein [Streptomyces sp. NPDC058464]|uniref:nuclear transport factor 2 family protein n=1 Tax=Streptomyces sp. NPDC058464 TaxID=3346511 RepID=UPI00364D02C4
MTEHNTKADKEIVLDFLRRAIAEHDPVAVRELVAAGFVEHSPGLPQDRQALEEQVRSRGPKPGAETGEPEFVVAEDGLVTVCFYVPQPEPEAPEESYDYFSFDTYRVRDGLIAEHWSNFNKIAPLPLELLDGPARRPVTPEPGASSAELADRKQLVTDLYRCVFDAMNPDAIKDIVADDYTQHARWRAEQGRVGLETFVRGLFRTVQPKPVQPEVMNKPTILMAEGDIVIYAQPRPQPEPDDESKTYIYLVFDAFRVRDGLLAEHWSGINKIAPPKPPKMPPMPK